MKDLGLKWSELQINQMYNIMVYKGDCLYYSNGGTPIYDSNIILLKKSEDNLSIVCLPINRYSSGITKDISKTEFENKIVFTYA